MKPTMFMLGFALIAVLIAPHLAAMDPEPLGAAVSLYLFGIALVVPCTLAFCTPILHRLPPYSALIAFSAGALCSGIFYAVLAFAFPTLLLVPTLLIGGISSVAVSFTLSHLVLKYWARRSEQFNAEADTKIPPINKSL